MLFNASAGVLIWLLGISLLDLTRRELDHWNSTYPLLALTLLRMVYPPVRRGGQEHLLAASVLVLLLVLLLSADYEPLFWVFSVSAWGLAWQTQTLAMPILVSSWWLAMLWTRWGVWGAGDAKVVMILLSLWPDLYLVGALLGTLLVGSLLTLYLRYKTGALLAIMRAWAELPKGPPVAEQVNWTQAATVPWLSLGYALFYVGRLVWA